MTLTIRTSNTSARHARRAAPVRLLPTQAAACLPLGIILVVQSIFSAQLIHHGHVTGDESLYIYSGHQLIRELWHGGGSPYYETYFSGVPDFYPILAATADTVGGLAAARLMSLVFMLATTVLLYLTARRLFGYLPAIAAAALFAFLGITHALGALATFDAMALMLIAAGAYCAVRSADSDGVAGTRWLLLIPVFLVAANAIKYASVLFDPVVIGMAVTRLREHGEWKRAGQRFFALTSTVAVLCAVMLFTAGTAYLQGVLFTTIARKTGSQALFGATYVPARQILLLAWDWGGAIFVLGALAVIASWLIRRERRSVPLLAVTLLPSVLVVAEYAHLHANTSFSKHADYAAWFTCIAAGYILARSAELAHAWQAKVPLTTVAIAVAILGGAHYINNGSGMALQLQPTPQLDSLFVMAKPYIELKNGRYLIGGLQDTRMLYTDHVSVAWYQYFDDVYVKYPIPGRGGDSHGEKPGRACFALKPGCMYLEGPAGYEAAIHAHWFAVVSMVGDHNTPQDTDIIDAVQSTPGYRYLTNLGGAPTYVYAPDYERHGLSRRDPMTHHRVNGAPDA